MSQRLGTSFLEKRLERLRGVSITTADESRRLSCRGTVREAIDYLEAMEEGGAQVLTFVSRLSHGEAAVYITANKLNGRFVPSAEALLAHSGKGAS